MTTIGIAIALFLLVAWVCHAIYWHGRCVQCRTKFPQWQLINNTCLDCRLDEQWEEF